MKKLFLLLFLFISVYLNAQNAPSIVVAKTNWTYINKKAIVKLIVNQEKLENKIKSLEKLMKQKDKLFIVKTYSANIRKNPSIKAKVVGFCRKNQIIYIEKFIGFWGKIGKNMYISRYVLSKKE